MSHLNKQPHASGQPMTRPQREAALFQRMIHLCDQQDDLIHKQQLEIDRLRQQLGTQPVQAPTNEAPTHQAPNHQERPRRTKMRSIQKAPLPLRMKPTPVDPVTTKRESLSTTNRDEKHAGARPSEKAAALPKPCLPDALQQGHVLPDGQLPPGAQLEPMAMAPRHAATDQVNRQDGCGPRDSGECLGTEIGGVDRSPIHPAETPVPHGSIVDPQCAPADQCPPDDRAPDRTPAPTTPQVGRHRKGNKRVRDLLNQYFDRVPMASGQSEQGTCQASVNRLRRHWPEAVDTWPRVLNN